MNETQRVREIPARRNGILTFASAFLGMVAVWIMTGDGQSFVWTLAVSATLGAIVYVLQSAEPEIPSENGRGMLE